jgi:hypothetical protein
MRSSTQPRASVVLTLWLSITAADGLVLVACRSRSCITQWWVTDCRSCSPAMLSNQRSSATMSTPMLRMPVSLVERGPVRRTTSSHHSRDSTDR